MITATLACALLFAAIHVAVPRMAILHGARRSGWLSASGGIAVAYVFLHVLPDLTEHNEVLAGASGAADWLADRIVYLVALAGLASFYALERSVQVSRRLQRAATGHDRPHHAVFWVHIGGFAVYNLLIGYLLLHREEPGYLSLGLYGFAMAVHFLGNDDALYRHHRTLYRSTARWVIATAVLAGWTAGLVVDIPAAAISLAFAFLAGGIVVNVLKDEIPEDSDSRVLPFLAGAAGYSAVILAL